MSKSPEVWEQDQDLCSVKKHCNAAKKSDNLKGETKT